ncbi:DUF2306 domain-containing protein [Algoriphagus confluentis]|uniref:DUF2306 domain-containing protein n=1 Tax=Algoriphagus confluentis TaxID=1697556 RepID=A0ABQ6PRI8_9BACT|nr:hypothetical protein Aconfl_28050 [Algoriphagus confluentis]
MSKSVISIEKRPKSWPLPLFWVFLIFFAGKFILNDALPYFGLEESVFGDYWEMKWPLIGHISGGLIALTLGPFQFWAGFRNNYLKVHRIMGMAYICGILIAVISSIALSLTIALDFHWTWSLSLIGLAFAWFGTTGMAFRFILLRRINLHKEWMIRSYVVTFAFVLFRWLTRQPFYDELGPFVETGPTAIWLSWVLPLFITEIVLQWNKR